MKCVLSLIITATLFASCLPTDWGYGKTDGPDTWSKTYPDCSGTAQSPIDIKENQAVVDSALGVFHHSLFQTLPTSMTIVNTGHSLQVNLQGGYTINDNNLLPGKYQAVQFHFHWAKNDSTKGGSEHTLNGQQYFAEMHVVHYNTKYSSFAEAQNNENGLAVLGFFITPDAAEDNLDFNRMLNLLGDIPYGGENQTYATLFSLDVILPHNLSSYYRYKGSLTTPPCSETVVWSVFPDPIRISSTQKVTLQSGLFEKNDSTSPIGDDFRPVQPLNSRQITRPPGCNGAPSSFPSLSTNLLTIAVISVVTHCF